MSIIIKGMDMPKSCADCSVTCKVGYEDYIATLSMSERPDFCPLIEIPTPHGRLIAEGSILDQLQKIEDITALSHIDLGEEPYDDADEIMLPISTIRKILDRCITILEAEE